jgi:uncharacterized membrane protein YjgN (DUF898 family)
MRVVERVYSDNEPAGIPPVETPMADTAQLPEGAVAEPAEMNAASVAAKESAPETVLNERQKSRDKTRETLKDPKVVLAFLIGMVVYLVIIFIFAGYLQARVANLLWNNTTLDQLSFKSSLRARDFIWLYFSNFVAILLSFGLATPWVQIRMARYRASRLVVVGDVDFDQFVGDKKAEVKATGEEIADMFDLDLSFG